ncbi:MAG: MMPL family transporter [Motiliproteus sp.]
MSLNKDHAEHPVLDAVNASETFFERIMFNNRPLWIVLFSALTLFFGYNALQIKPDASFDKMIPTNHSYVANYLQHKSDIKGMGNSVRISVETTEGDIYTQEFMETLKQVHDEAFYIPGVDRAALKSLWAPAVRWLEVTEEGFEAGPVIPDTYNGSQQSLDLVRSNVAKSGQVGALVANNARSAVIYAPLLDNDPDTGEPLDYQLFSERMEQLLRDKYQTDTVKIHITGFAKVVGDLIDGASQVAIFFAVALVITMVMLYAYSHCVRSSVIPLLCSVIAVVWQLGLLNVLGYGLDPYSMLVPFLVFAIAVSHGVQIINAIGHESATGAGKELAARRAFRSLYIPGIIALVSDGVGFATLMVIEIAVIQDLAIAASMGVAVIILTNLMLLPILMSYTGTSVASVKKLEREEKRGKHPIWNLLTSFTQRKRALPLILVAVAMAVAGIHFSKDLQIGDLDPGAPELRPDSRYNLDNAFITANYTTSTDLFVVMVTSAKDQCANYAVLDAADQLQWRLQQLPGVQSSRSLVNSTKQVIAGSNEGNLKWYALNRNQQLLDQASIRARVRDINSYNTDCSVMPVVVYLNDHKAATLASVVEAVELFKSEFDNDTVIFKLAAGNSGIEAATNIVIEKAQYNMLIWVYSVVGVLCLITFRSIRTVLCILLPLALTSILCQALMTYIGIGVKVATLPVIALGVGIGVDYGIYIYSKLQTYLNAGMDLKEAYFNTLKTTGKAVAFTGVTLGIGVGTWVLSPIKFQADMGILLTFMFVWNMIGALVFLPALACFLLKKQRPSVAESTPATAAKVDTQANTPAEDGPRAPVNASSQMESA